MVSMDFLAVTIEIEKAGELRNVSSVAEAAEVLMQWPHQRGKAWAVARRVCRGAMAGKDSVEAARSAFVTAAKEANILVWNSAWKF